MKSIQVLDAVVIDDEQTSRMTLCVYLETYCPSIRVVGQADSVVSGAKLINDKKPDVVFADIRMGDGTGFDMIEICSYKKFQVVFITAYTEYAVKAFQYSAVDYLLKPIDENLLQQSVEKLHKVPDENGLSNKLDTLIANQSQLQKLAIPSINTVEIVKVEDIVRFEANNNYTTIYLEHQKIVSSKTLKEYDVALQDTSFYRVHKSHLINLNKIKRFIQEDGGYAIMTDGSKVEVARRRKDDFLNVLMNG